MTKVISFIMSVISALTAIIMPLFNKNKPADKDMPVYTSEVFEKGWSNDNCGYPVCGEDVDRLISVRPSELQANFSENEYYNFIHFGMNTFTNREWGTGKEKPCRFHPVKVDTDQWARVLKESGSSGIIFTAKHHDGFCLFQTAYTEHSIKNSPYKNGKGDIVKELAESCKKYGLKFGIYLSPWDMHEPTYGTEAYNDFFVNQLTELCTNYGELFAVWFDGAKGDDAVDFTYDFNRYYNTIRELQPNCVISCCGPDIRWIGNENGETQKSEWSVIPASSVTIDKIMADSQHGENDTDKLQHSNYENPENREYYVNHRDLTWQQAEADVSVRKDWFYHPFGKQRTADELADIYFNTVGGNALLLLNVPPSSRGVIELSDIILLKKFKMKIDMWLDNKLDFTVTTGIDNETADIDSIKDADSSYTMKNGENSLILKLDGKTDIKSLVIREDIRQSQRIEKYEVYIKQQDNEYIKAYDGTVVGSKKIIRFTDLLNIQTDEIVILIKQSRGNPVIRDIEIYG